MADQPQTNTLDKNKFIVAVRLIQLFQNGKKPVDSELHVGGGEVVRPPFFEGVQIPIQQPQQQPMSPQQPPQQQMPPPQQQQQYPSPALQPTPTPSQMPTPQQSPLRPVQPSMQQHQLPMPPNLSNANTALTTQDPYTMTPQEQSRYDALFPSYAQSDGYVYGQQAVELFSKSGMDREHLKGIWAMSDDPVDNKLDQVEFAIAMHLIVCITKKGLGMPPALPPSLARVLREPRGQPMKAASQMGSGPPLQQQSMMGGLAQQQGLVSPSSPGGIPSPDKMPQMGVLAGQPQQPQMQQMQQPQVQPSHPQMGQAVPTLQQTESFGAVGGEAIDDAFAGLSNEPVEDVDEYSHVGGMSAAGGMTTMGGSVMPIQQATQAVYGSSMASQHVAPISPKPSPVPAYQSVSPQQSQPKPPGRPPLSPAKAKTNQTSVDDGFNEELEKLRVSHQKLQAEVISLRAKASLVSDEEIDAQNEMKALASGIAELSMELSGLKDQVAEAKSNLADALVTLKAQKDKKETLEESVKDARETYDALVSATEAVTEANEALMMEHAKVVAATASAKAAEKEQHEPAVSVQTADLFSWDSAPAPAPISMDPLETETTVPATGMGMAWGSDAAPSIPLPSEHPVIETAHQATVKNEDEASRYGEALSVYTAQTANNGVPTQHGGYQPNVAEVPPANTAFPFPMGGAPATVATPMAMDGGQGALVPSNIQSNPYGGFMGGDQSVMSPMGVAPPAVTLTAVEQPTPQKINSPTAAEVDSMKREAMKAEKSFRQSEDLVRTLSQEVNNLESAAKKAEEEASAIEAASKKKKGSFVGGKKKVKKELEKAQEYANAERQKVIGAREQLSAAQREAEKSRKEAEQLRQQCEKAEIEAATAASYVSAHAEAPTPIQPASNGYSDPFGMNYGNSENYGMGLMGGSSQNQDYSNPFAM
jgi:hypothetical protein